ncbi:MAG: hypothetical protein ACT4RN_11135, partial [Pseudonocardia sp.]
PARAGAWVAVTAATHPLVLVGVARWAGHERAEFAAGSFTEVEAAFGAAGLTVCAATGAPDPLAPAAVASRSYELGTGCTGDVAAVVVDRFADVAHRDAAALRFEGLVRPRGSGVVYTLGDTTVFVRGSGDHAVQERLDPALRAAGAR